MTRALLIDPFSGASGDMLLASVISAGVPFEDIRKRLGAIPVLGAVKVSIEPVRRGMFQASRLVVDMPHEHAHRSLSAIRAMIEESALSDAVKRGAVGAFTALAGAEATVHGCEADTVTFHEVGALDSILDIVGWYSAMDILGWPPCYYTRLTLGSGSIRSAHGDIPLPAPATMELLKGHPVSFSDRLEELITPTAAAIMAAGFRPLSSSRVFAAESIGYGAGTRDTAGGLPNVLRTMLGSVRELPSQVCIVTCTIDDMNPELYGYIMEKLFARGALEVYFNAVMMKKNRPGLEMTVITEEKDVQEMAAFILSETTTIGLRVGREERIELPRERAEVATPYGTIAVKVVTLPGGERRMSPEYESCRAAAEKAKARMLDVFDAVRAAWEKRRA
jgi:hypothetical protein